MDQKKFEAAEAILHPPNSTPERSNSLNSTFLLRSPEGVWKGSAEYYRRKLEQNLEHIAQLSETTPKLENVPGLMPFKRIAPTKSKNKTLTKMRGSLKSTELRKLVEEREKAEEEAERWRKEKHLKKEEMKGAFQGCKLKCLCGENVCKATQLKESSVCFDVLKMQCHKEACKNDDGELPKMIGVASKRENIWKGQKREYYQSSDESDTEI